MLRPDLSELQHDTATPLLLPHRVLNKLDARELAFVIQFDCHDIDALLLGQSFMVLLIMQCG